LPEGFTDLSWLILFATVPAAIAGKIFGDQLEAYFGTPLSVAFMLASVAILFLVAEKYAKLDVELSKLSFSKALLIGLSQIVALLPGTSRSGITIITGLSLGLKREAAVRFSFLLSIPVIAGAAVVKVPKLLEANLNGDERTFLIIAFLSAVLSGFWAIKFMLKFIKTTDLKPFAYYRFILAAVIVALSLLNML
jgi:undecaprenyl-diphosphatase